MGHRAVRTSAKARAIKDGRMLAVKPEDQDGVFYIMQGEDKMPVKCCLLLTKEKLPKKQASS